MSKNDNYLNIYKKSKDMEYLNKRNELFYSKEMKNRKVILYTIPALSIIILLPFLSFENPLMNSILGGVNITLVTYSFFQSFYLNRIYKEFLGTYQNHNNDTIEIIFTLIPFCSSFVFIIFYVSFYHLTDVFFEVDKVLLLEQMYIATIFFIIISGCGLFFINKKKVKREYINNNKIILESNFQENIDFVKKELLNEYNDYNKIDLYLEKVKTYKNQEYQDFVSSILDELLKNNGYESIYEYKESLVKNDVIEIS